MRTRRVIAWEELFYGRAQGGYMSILGFEVGVAGPGRRRKSMPGGRNNQGPEAWYFRGTICISAWLWRRVLVCRKEWSQENKLHESYQPDVSRGQQRAMDWCRLREFGELLFWGKEGRQ